MIYLLNRQVVLAEILELTRNKLVGMLRVPIDAVKIRVEMEGDKLVPHIDVDMEAAKGLTQAHVQELVTVVYRRMRLELEARLEGLHTRRRRGAEKDTASPG